MDLGIHGSGVVAGTSPQQILKTKVYELCPDWILQQKKNISGKAGEFKVKSGVKLKTCTDIGFSVLTIPPWSCKIYHQGKLNEEWKETVSMTFAIFLQKYSKINLL